MFLYFKAIRPLYISGNRAAVSCCLTAKIYWCCLLCYYSKFQITFSTNVRNELHDCLAYVNETNGKDTFEYFKRFCFSFHRPMNVLSMSLSYSKFIHKFFIQQSAYIFTSTQLSFGNQRAIHELNHLSDIINQHHNSTTRIT